MQIVICKSNGVFVRVSAGFIAAENKMIDRVGPVAYSKSLSRFRVKPAGFESQKRLVTSLLLQKVSHDVHHVISLSNFYI